MILQVKKRTLKDEGNQRYAGISTFAVLPEVKNVIVVDEDVDIFDPYDVLWALTTRFRPDKDLITIPGLRGHQGDPTEKRYFIQKRLRGASFAVYRKIYSSFSSGK